MQTAWPYPTGYILMDVYKYIFIWPANLDFDTREIGLSNSMAWLMELR